MNRTLVLLSGGIDSAVLLRKLHSEREVVPVFFAYGQRGVEPEFRAATAQCRTLGLDLIRLDLGSLVPAFLEGSRERKHVPLPYRNCVLLSVALSYARKLEAERVALATILGDGQFCPTGGGAFLMALDQLAKVLGAAQLEAPLANWSKKAVVEEGRRLGLDFFTTYSCMVGHPMHCGRCSQCVARSQALEALFFPRSF